MPMGTNRVRLATSLSANHAPWSPNMGTRDMLSTPPATTTPSLPEATFWAASAQAVRPEAQELLTVRPRNARRPAGIEGGDLADIRALLAGLRDAADDQVFYRGGCAGAGIEAAP